MQRACPPAPIPKMPLAGLAVAVRVRHDEQPLRVAAEEVHDRLPVDPPVVDPFAEDYSGTVFKAAEVAFEFHATDPFEFAEFPGGEEGAPDPVVLFRLRFEAGKTVYDLVRTGGQPARTRNEHFCSSVWSPSLVRKKSGFF